MAEILRRKSILILLFCFCAIYYSAAATDTAVIRILMSRIYNEQVKQHSFFPAGMFPSYREFHLTKGNLKEDDNIFFTALVSFTLRKLQADLSHDLQDVCDSIFYRSAPLYKKFQNRRGFPVYSYWMTDPVKLFPNSPILSKFKSKALPDDVDCTAIVLQAKKASKSDVQQMHNYIQAYTNDNKQKIRNSYLGYRGIPAYSTWLGYRMPADLDVCVLANVLLLVHVYDLKYTSADSASLKVITEVVRKREYMTHSAFASPYYQSTSVILYHLSRLMASRKIPELEQYKEQLIEDAKTSYLQTKQFIDKVILSTSLMRWNSIATDYHISTGVTNYLNNSNHDFVFFYATMASMLPNPLNKWAMKLNAGRFNYYCPAYNDVLVLENLVFAQKMNTKVSSNVD
jgi:hypothetical protein